MKKHNEGYTLPLVLVVMIVMCLIAVSVMSVALHNLQAQKASVTRMQDKYEAQGEIEEVVAKLDYELKTLKTGTGTTNKSVEEEIQAPVVEAINTALKLPDEEQQSVKLLEQNGIVWTKSDNGDFSCAISMCAMSLENNVQIVCTILLEDVITIDGTTHFYQTPPIVYTSYEIGGAG